jgi:hypothetical protein
MSFATAVTEPGDPIGLIAHSRLSSNLASTN